jgi:hypothetical protein
MDRSNSKARVEATAMYITYLNFLSRLFHLCFTGDTITIVLYSLANGYTWHLSCDRIQPGYVRMLEASGRI